MEGYFMPGTLEDAEFELIRKMVYQETGIKLSDHKKIMVQSRLIKRLKQLKCTDFYAYVKQARQNPGERSIMLNLITTNVTKFFRENHHFEFLARYLPEYMDQALRGRPLRVWSAGCSTGQEPYSIAISLNEFLERKTRDFKILASDINTEVLHTAAKGTYSWEEVDEVPYNLLKKYFKMGEGANKGLFKVKDILTRKISFRQVNLADGGPDFPVDGTFDFIFCRNVFIYFDQETKRRAIRKYFKKLNNGGCLFLGHSESLNREDAFNGTWVPMQHTVYMKREGGAVGGQN